MPTPLVVTNPPSAISASVAAAVMMAKACSQGLLVERDITLIYFGEHTHSWILSGAPARLERLVYV